MDIYIFIILVVIALLGAFAVHLIRKPNVIKGIFISTLCFTIAGGLALYSYSYFILCPNPLVAIFRSIYAVIRLFLGEENYSDVAALPLFANWWCQLLFWICHILGPFTTAGAAISAFGSKIMERIRLRLSRRGNVSIILGVTEETLRFGSEMAAEEYASVVFVDNNPENITEETINNSGCILRTNVHALKGNEKFLKSLGIRSGRRNIGIYALTLDAVQNQEFAENILASCKKMNLSPQQLSLSIIGAEDEVSNPLQASDNHYGYGHVIVLDEPEMAARLLIQQYPPCDHMNFDENGKATDNFHSLIVGFDQVGQAVFRQIIRNAQFEGSTFKLTIFDPAYKQVIGGIWHECPSLFQNYDISFVDQDARSLCMFKYLEEHGPNLKYITICTGDERLNDKIAEDFRHFLARKNSPAKIYICTKKRICRQEGANSINNFELYAPSILCSNQIDRLAMLLNQTYCNGNGLSAKENWRRCDYFSRMSSRASADFAPAFMKAAHITKEDVLAGKWNPTGRLLENLSMTEHLRWNAFHYSMGFRPMTREEWEARADIYKKEINEKGSSKFRIGKDLNARIHACLIDWDSLDELSEREYAVTGKNPDYKQMDRNNVLTLGELIKATEKEK